MALFDPGELAAIRLMIVMRSMGLGPAVSRPLAESAAPSVVWIILCDYPDSWEVAAVGRRADEFRHKLDAAGDGHLTAMAKLKCIPKLFGVRSSSGVEFLPGQPDFEFDDDEEIETIIKLRGVARQIAHNLDRPMMRVSPA